MHQQQYQQDLQRLFDQYKAAVVAQNSGDLDRAYSSFVSTGESLLSLSQQLSAPPYAIVATNLGTNSRLQQQRNQVIQGNGGGSGSQPQQSSSNEDMKTFVRDLCRRCLALAESIDKKRRAQSLSATNSVDLRKSLPSIPVPLPVANASPLMRANSFPAPLSSQPLPLPPQVSELPPTHPITVPTPILFPGLHNFSATQNTDKFAYSPGTSPSNQATQRAPSTASPLYHPTSPFPPNPTPVCNSPALYSTLSAPSAVQSPCQGTSPPPQNTPIIFTPCSSPVSFNLNTAPSTTPSPVQPLPTSPLPISPGIFSFGTTPPTSPSLFAPGISPPPTSPPFFPCVTPPLPSGTSLLLQKPIPQQQTYYTKIVQQSAALNDIISQCIATKTKFQDPLFPATEESLVGLETEKIHSFPSVTWQRLSDIRGKSSKFPSPPQTDCLQISSDDGPVQGALGNCWLLGAFSLMAGKPDRLKSLFAGSRPDLGLFVIKFFRNRVWVKIIVDDQIPCGHYGVPLFGHNRNTVAKFDWVALLEKAYAKMCGSYIALENGHDSDALVDLTGGVAMNLNLHDEQSGRKLEAVTVWHLLVHYFEKEYMMGCVRTSNYSVSPSSMSGHLLVPNHAYGIISIHEINGKQYVRLRDPWGDDSITAHCKRPLPSQLAHLSGAGSFILPMEEFVLQCDRISLCKSIPPGWHETSLFSEWKRDRNTAGGCTNFPTWVKNPQFHVTVSQPCQVFIILSQGDYRKFGQASVYRHTIGAKLLSKGDTTGRKTLSISSTNVVDETKYVNVRDRILSVTLHPSLCPYVIMCSTHDPGDEANFKITVYSEIPLSLTEASDWHELCIYGRWGPGLCGGSMNNSSWRNNPAYMLDIGACSTGITIMLAANNIGNTSSGNPDTSNAPFVGLYVFSQHDCVTPVAHTEQFSEYITLELKTTQRTTSTQYTVVPATYDPNCFSSFTLTVLSAVDSVSSSVMIPFYVLCNSL
ncbi:calpain-type cysteine protease family [Pelomyxa schiedti]|nr:calpain-type cysteine protease family [Pelomyxa schiedti]